VSRRPIDEMAADVAVSGGGGGGGADQPSLSLDASGCVSLQDILLAFNAPISEEHAWALCFECVKCFQNALHEHGKCLVVVEPEHIVLHKDGQVHLRTVLPGGTPSSDKTGEFFISTSLKIFLPLF
jgi:hypothetical protein